MMQPKQSVPGKVAVVGGGPAGLMAAEVLSNRGMACDVFDRMPSVGRKFLMAGKGGLNITHSEPLDRFAQQYGPSADVMTPMLEDFGPVQLRSWVTSLGIDTFVGTSGRVFPTEMKAAPLLRAWIHRLRTQGVRFHVRHRLISIDTSDGKPPGLSLEFQSPQGVTKQSYSSVILAFGGGSWSKLGSDGSWVPMVERLGIEVAPLRPANCGFDCGWSEHFSSRFAGQALKSVCATVTTPDGLTITRPGECILTESGLEGSLIYALSAYLRDSLASTGSAMLWLDLAPGKSVDRLLHEISWPRGSRSMSSHLQSRAGIKGLKAGLLRECLQRHIYEDPVALVHSIKHLPISIHACRPLDEAISSAGGVCFHELDSDLMSQKVPGLFFAGEMLDWEAPTGGYLLTACMSTGFRAGLGAANLFI